MPQIIKKSLIKWSAIAVLGVSAYFVGYFWGVKNLNGDQNLRNIASEELQKATDFSELKERVH
ncbi:hypothetical protein [Bdellovibrio sp. HCB337]|uniref:hypothetical protein n=1 Tax=Bdellovibrio sp. HCB337 TaxID=3394358 RepID=UPI0039A485BA